MGGINDINAGIEPQKIATNLDRIAQRLNKNQIKPFITSIIYVSDTFPNYKEINKKVTLVNNLIKYYCDSKKITFIDLNTLLAPNQLLKPEYSFDGIHLTALGYYKWKESITPIISQELIK